MFATGTWNSGHATAWYAHTQTLTQAGSTNRPSLETKPGNETRPNGVQLAFAQFPYPLIPYVDGLFQYNQNPIGFGGSLLCSGQKSIIIKHSWMKEKSHPCIKSQYFAVIIIVFPKSAQIDRFLFLYFPCKDNTRFNLCFGIIVAHTIYKGWIGEFTLLKWALHFLQSNPHYLWGCECVLVHNYRQTRSVIIRGPGSAEVKSNQAFPMFPHVLMGWWSWYLFLSAVWGGELLEMAWFREWVVSGPTHGLITVCWALGCYHSGNYQGVLDRK